MHHWEVDCSNSPCQGWLFIKYQLLYWVNKCMVIYSITMDATDQVFCLVIYHLISCMFTRPLGTKILQCRSVIVDIPVAKNPNSKLAFKLKSYYKNSI